MKPLFRHLTVLIIALTVAMIPVVASAAPQNTESPDLVHQIMVAAAKNQTLNSVPFTIGDSLKNDVEKSWGKSDDKSTVVANYYHRHVSFFYDHSTNQETITGIHDYEPALSNITLNELKKQINKDPIQEREVEGNYEVTYHANRTHKIIFIFESKFVYKNPKLLSYLVDPK